MGGGKIDLREAQIQEREAVLDVFTLMGGLEIQVPDNWVVEPRITPILGGYQDRTNRTTQGTQRLVINGTAIMGGITVFN
jgi:predicted membrane protein